MIHNKILLAHHKERQNRYFHFYKNENNIYQELQKNITNSSQ